MNTDRKPVKKVMGKSCGHVFLLVGKEPIRTVKPITPHINPETGRPYTHECPYPRHG